MENLNPILIFKFMKIFWPPTIQTKKHLALIVNNTIVYKCSNLRIIISYNFMFKTTPHTTCTITARSGQTTKEKQR